MVGALVLLTLAMSTMSASAASPTKWKSNGDVQLDQGRLYWSETRRSRARLLSRPVAGGPVVVHRRFAATFEAWSVSGNAFAHGDDEPRIASLSGGPEVALRSFSSDDEEIVGGNYCDVHGYEMDGRLLIRVDLLYIGCGDSVNGTSVAIGLPWEPGQTFTPFRTEVIDTLWPFTDGDTTYANGQVVISEESSVEFLNLGLTVGVPGAEYNLSSGSASTSGFAVVTEHIGPMMQVRRVDAGHDALLWSASGYRDATFCGDRLIEKVTAPHLTPKSPRRGSGGGQRGSVRGTPTPIAFETSVSKLQERALDGSVVRSLWRRPKGVISGAVHCDADHIAVGLRDRAPALIALAQ